MLQEINFNFDSTNTHYLTHSLHPYPAKFPPQLPKAILEKFAKEGDLVLDPFCGSGTTLVEARLLKINSIGVDVNGLACLLSKVKATPLNKNQINEINLFKNTILTTVDRWENGKREKIKIKEINNLTHWFQNNVSEEITFILNGISKLKDEKVQNFLKIVLSSIIVKVSNQDSDTRYAAKDKNIKNNFTIKTFIERMIEYERKITEFSQIVDSYTTLSIHNADSRNLAFIAPESIDLIITSPPYANTYDYYLYHKFRKLWLDLDVNFAQYNEIGSRREFSSLKKSSQKWTEDLILCFIEMHKVLKKGGMAFIVIGDSVINKNLIKIDEIIKGFSNEINFKFCEIISTDLASHSRIFNPLFAQKGKKEHLILLEKK